MDTTRVYVASKTIIASRTTGEIRCVPTDSATFMAAQPGSPWFLVCSEPEELQQAAAGPGDGGTFEPIGADVRRTAKALSYVPHACDEALVRKGEPRLQLFVDHYTLGRRNMPRKPEGIAEMEALIASDLPHRGKVTIPFPAIETWTTRTMRRAIGLMVDRLPGGPHSPRDVHVSIHTFDHHHVVGPHNHIEVSGSSFRVELKMVQECPASFWWKYFGSLAELDVLIHNEAKAKAQAREKAAKAADGDDNDPELTWIERLARKHLHGPGVDDE